MPLWTKQDLMTACKASDPTSNFLNNFDNIHGISIDDRTIKKGELFIALIGNVIPFNLISYSEIFVDSIIASTLIGTMPIFTFFFSINNAILLFST